MIENNNPGLFLVWKKYQRRAEVLAPLICADILFMPHSFRSRYFRLFDYLMKFAFSLYSIRRLKPRFIVAQAPPLFSALPAYILRVPYIIDAHNPVFQDVGGKISWGELPLSKFIIRHAKAVIVHNHRILEVSQELYPSTVFFNIPDPVEPIVPQENVRIDKQILVISSFDPDEPVDVLLDCIFRLPEYNFVITADPLRLSPSKRSVMSELPNIRLTGFLPIEDYHQVLCQSMATIVLTTQDMIQPSGACEALSSNTQLLISKTSLTEELFGSWAVLVDNSSESIVNSIRSLKPKCLDLEEYRFHWNQNVFHEIMGLSELLT